MGHSLASQLRKPVKKAEGPCPDSRVGPLADCGGAHCPGCFCVTCLRCFSALLLKAVLVTPPYGAWGLHFLHPLSLPDICIPSPLPPHKGTV